MNDLLHALSEQLYKEIAKNNWIIQMAADIFCIHGNELSAILS